MSDKSASVDKASFEDSLEIRLYRQHNAALSNPERNAIYIAKLIPYVYILSDTIVIIDKTISYKVVFYGN